MLDLVKNRAATNERANPKPTRVVLIGTQAKAIDIDTQDVWRQVWFEWDAAGGASHLWAAIAHALMKPDVSTECDVILVTDGRDSWGANDGDGGALQLLQRGFRGRLDVLCTRIDPPPPLSKLAGLFGGIYHAVDLPAGAAAQRRPWDAANATLDSIDDFLIAQLLHEEANEPAPAHGRLPDGRLGRATQFFMRELRDDPSGLRRWEAQLAGVQQRSAQSPPRLQLAALERAASALRNIEANRPRLPPAPEPASPADSVISINSPVLPQRPQLDSAAAPPAAFRAPWIMDMQATPSAQQPAVDGALDRATPYDPRDRAHSRGPGEAGVGAPDAVRPKDTASLLTEVVSV